MIREPVMCAKGHGPKGADWRCKTCDRERQRRKAQAQRERAAAATHCKRGHPYREGSWRLFTRVGQDGHTATVRTCLLCLEAARRKCAAQRQRTAAKAEGVEQQPAPKPLRHLKKFDAPARYGFVKSGKKRSYPGKVNLRRVDLQERIGKIHREILDACARMDLMSAAELTEWKNRRAELVKEADLLQAQLDRSKGGMARRRRVAQ